MTWVWARRDGRGGCRGSGAWSVGDEYRAILRVRGHRLQRVYRIGVRTRTCASSTGLSCWTVSGVTNGSVGVTCRSDASWRDPLAGCACRGRLDRVALGATSWLAAQAQRPSSASVHPAEPVRALQHAVSPLEPLPRPRLHRLRHLVSYRQPSERIRPARPRAAASLRQAVTALACHVAFSFALSSPSCSSRNARMSSMFSSSLVHCSL